MTAAIATEAGLDYIVEEGYFDTLPDELERLTEAS
jgi:hypothetical protein